MALDLGRIAYSTGINDSEYYDKLKKMENSAEKSTSNINRIFAKLAVTIGVAKQFWDGVKAAREFSRELANIKSVAPELSLRKLRTELNNLSSELGSSAQLANALYFAYSAGIRGSEKEMADFTGQIAMLAKAVNSEVTPVMDAATTMMNAYGLTVKDAGQLSDWFYTVVKQGKTEGPVLANSLGMIASGAAAAKVPLNDLGAALATLTTTMPTPQAVTSLNMVLMAFVKPTEQAAQAAAELGIDLSAATIQEKGLVGAINEINQKAGNNVDALGKMFTSVEAFKAVTALASTQLGTFNDNAIQFANSGGSALQAFEAQAASGDATITMLTTTMTKLGRIFAEMVGNTLTLGGALNPLFKAFGEMSATTLTATARIIGISVAMTGLYKTIMAIKGLELGKRLINFGQDAIVKGGGKTNAVLEAEIIEKTEKIKELATIASTKKREQVEAMRHAREMDNIRKEQTARLKQAKQQYKATPTGHLPYNTTVVMKESTQEIEKATNARREYTKQALQAAKANQVATAAIATHGKQLKALQMQSAIATSAMGKMKLAIHGVGGAFKAMGAAIMANPIGAILMVITGMYALIESLHAKAINKLNAALEKLEKEREIIQETSKENNTRRDADRTALERLEELSNAQKLNSDEMAEAQALTKMLTKHYQDLGVAIDENTGKISIQTDAWAKLSEAQKAQKEQEFLTNMDTLKKQEKIAAQKLGRLTGQHNVYGSYLTSDYILSMDNEQLSALYDGNSDAGNIEVVEAIQTILDIRKKKETTFFEHAPELNNKNNPSDKTTAEDITQRAQLSNEAKELQRESDLNRMKAKAWADGELSQAEELLIKKQEIANQQERITDAQAKANNAAQVAAKAAGTEQEQRKKQLQMAAENALFQAQQRLGELTKEYRESAGISSQNKNQQSFGSFYADSFDKRRNGNSLQERTAKANEAILKATSDGNTILRDIRNNTYNYTDTNNSGNTWRV